jgi:hypothetical protein
MMSSEEGLTAMSSPSTLSHRIVVIMTLAPVLRPACAGTAVRAVTMANAAAIALV